MAEFVDNSVESYLRHKDKLEKAEGPDFQLKVSIMIEPGESGRLIIRDNAAGIHESEYERAFRPAEIPPDRTGLAEFGMGMKSAACWFASEWEVRSSALGEPVEKTVSFDIEKIVRDDLEDLEVDPQPAKQKVHFTEIVLTKLHRSLHGNTIAKIKDHLASIYRVFIREGVLVLSFNGEPLVYAEPAVLVAPHYRAPAQAPRKTWKKNFELDFGLGWKARGFAAIRATASTTRAGFALFRRKRLIEGSLDEGYRPEYIFGKPNSYRYQRIFGEIHLDGFGVSHTKDGFKWEEHEEIFLEFLKQELKRDPLDLLDQAEEWRVRAKADDLKKSAELASQRTAEVIKREVPPVVQTEIDTPPSDAAPPKSLPPHRSESRREILVELRGTSWLLNLDLTNDPAIGDWLTVSDKATVETVAGLKVRRLSIAVSLTHPFMERFAGADATQIEALVRLGAAIGLAEIVARDSGIKMAVTIRRTINELLRSALSKP
jgi:histidine kinase/DNA gyrase B/HSP90-like ATPase